MSLAIATEFEQKLGSRAGIVYIARLDVILLHDSFVRKEEE